MILILLSFHLENTINTPAPIKLSVQNKMISQVFFLLGGFFLIAADCYEEFKDPGTISPWTLVYTVEPYYQSEALVNFWKSEKNVKVPDELLAWPLMGHRVPNKSNLNDTVKNHQHQQDSMPSQLLNKKIIPEITYWPPRKSNDQRPPIVIPRYFDSV